MKHAAWMVAAVAGHMCLVSGCGDHSGSAGLPVQDPPPEQTKSDELQQFDLKALTESSLKEREPPWSTPTLDARLVGSYTSAKGSTTLKLDDRGGYEFRGVRGDETGEWSMQSATEMVLFPIMWTGKMIPGRPSVTLTWHDTGVLSTRDLVLRKE